MSARILLAAVFLLAGCAHQDAAVSQCEGAPRAANPYGSVLAPDTPITPPPAAPAAAGGCA